MDAASKVDVGSWLRALGLGRYEALFRENEIDADVLPELTDRHLREIGVALGHRLRMRRALRALAPPSPPAPGLRSLVPAPADGAERRQLTVMFYDLVGLNALAARLDPEDITDLIRATQSVVAAAVARFDGHVAKWVGDGATIYFGYPRAHEDDAERAAHAAIALIQAVARLCRERDTALEARVGISTGLVVVGELIGEGESLERGVVGDTPNIAARFRTLAEPGTIVISESTRRLLGSSFELKSLGPQVIEGFRSPIPAWLILRAQENVGRFEASRSGALTPFIGREEEIAHLEACWHKSAGGQGHVVLLSGEAGIGKSRLLAMLRERIGEAHHYALCYQCSPHHVNDAFYPVIGQIRHVAGFVSGEAPEVRLAKLETTIERANLNLHETVPFLAALLSIPTAERYPPLELAPREVKERTTTILMELLVALSKQAPLLVILEDAHWIDPSTRDLTFHSVAKALQLPVLLVVTFRPEFVPPWTRGSHITSLSLGRFAREQAIEVIGSITSGKALPAEVLEQIIVKTDGVPLFMEELTKSVLESGLLREERDAYVLPSAPTPLAIPSTLHDSLMARLDRLAPIKEIAQIGAAIGREFPYALLAAVSPIKGEALNDALRQLAEAELIHGRGTPPEASYAFKHALVQEAAYGSLLRGRRQRIHADIARALEQRLAADGYPPATIAYHYTEAGLPAAAVPAWLTAAEMALSQSAPVEAERHASAGLALIPRMTGSDERNALELGLLVARANAMVPLKSISAPETFEALAAAKAVLDRGSGTDLQRVSILYGLCSATTLTAQLSQAREFADQIIEVAERLDDPVYRVVGYRQLGTIRFYTGDNREALASLQKGAAYRGVRRHKALSYRFGWDQGLAIRCFEVLVRLSLGLLDSAARLREQVRNEVCAHDHATTIASATFCATTWPELVLGDLEGLERDSRSLLSYCIEKRIEQIRLWASFHCAYARSMREPIESNIAAMRMALRALHRSGGNTGNSIALCNLAEALLAAGDLDGAEAALQEGFAFVDRSEERYWLADLHRLNGRLALRRPQPDRTAAEACFHQAIGVAQDQQARLLELRAATDLARLWREDRIDRSPRRLIEPILSQIEGGETTRDVREARNMLG